MSNHDNITAPGRSAFWTEAALRALTGTAFLCHEGGEVDDEAEPLHESAVRAIALDAMAIATAFESACLAAHEAEQEARRERVRAIGRFRFCGMGTVYTVETVNGDDVTFALVPGAQAKRTSTVEHVLDPECYEPAPLDALAPPTTGGEAASK